MEHKYTVSELSLQATFLFSLQDERGIPIHWASFCCKPKRGVCSISFHANDESRPRIGSTKLVACLLLQGVQYNAFTTFAHLGPVTSPSLFFSKVVQSKMPRAEVASVPGGLRMWWREHQFPSKKRVLALHTQRATHGKAEGL